MGGSSKTTQKQNQTQTVQLPEWLNQAGQAAVNKAQTIANKPYTPYTGQLVAPLSSNQNSAISLAPTLAGAGQGAASTASNALGGAASTANGATGNWMGAVNNATGLYNAAGDLAAGTTGAGATSANNAAALAALAGNKAVNDNTAGQADLDAARTYTANSAGSFSPDEINSYINPYVSAAVDPVVAQLQKVAGQNSVNLASKAAMGGSFGGSRYGLQDAQNQSDLLNQVAQVTGQGYSDAYNAAVAEAENRAARDATAAGLSQTNASTANTLSNDALSRLTQAASANETAGTTQSDLATAALNRLSQAGQNQLNLGTTQSQLSTDDVNRLLAVAGMGNSTATTQSQLANDALNRLLSTGALQQEQGQNEDNAAYQQWQNEQNYPLTQLNALIAAAGGVPYGATTTATGTTTTSQPSNLLGQLLGAGSTIGGAIIASDENAKEDIKPVDDEDVLDKLRRVGAKGYRYKPEVRAQIGDDGRKRIGPMAQDWGREFAGDPNRKVIPMPEAVGALTSAVRGLEKRTRHLKRAA